MKSRVLALALVAACGCASPAITFEGGRFRVAGGEPGSLSVFVAGASDPVFGAQRVEDGVVVFEPRFPLREGLEYRAVFTPKAGPPVERTFSILALPPGP